LNLTSFRVVPAPAGPATSNYTKRQWYEIHGRCMVYFVQVNV